MSPSVFGGVLHRRQTRQSPRPVRDWGLLVFQTKTHPKALALVISLSQRCYFVKDRGRSCSAPHTHDTRRRRVKTFAVPALLSVQHGSATNNAASNTTLTVWTQPYSNRPTAGLSAPHFGHDRADPDTSVWQSRHVFNRHLRAQ